ncbi:SRPBCC family protein [Streptomyces sp. NPDC054796]
MAEQQRDGGPVSGIKETLTNSPATGRLKEAAASYAAAQAQRLLVSTGRKLGETTNLLNDVAEGRSPGLTKMAREGGKKFAEGKGPLRSVLEIGASGVKDKAKDAFQNLTGGGKKKGGGGKGKFVTIVEQTDVGVPVREAYNQWTQFQEFSTFAKGVQGVEATDDVSSNWRAKIFWSSRSWQANTTEQVPDERIAWTSEGAKGTTRGVVTFHALTDTLTRVLLVIEYYPKGLFEKTGNIWRAQGRRARLDLKHFRRFVMMRGEATGEWRGEIRDGEVVRTHEEALEDEDRGTHEEAPEDEEPEDEEPEDEDRGAHEDDVYEDEEEEEEEPAEDEDEEAEAEADEREPEPERVR